MPSLLRARHGKDYVVFGFAFGEGSFQVRDWSKAKGTAVTEVTLGAPATGDVSAPFRATGKPIVVAYTQEDVDDWTRAMVRSFAACGVHSGDIIQNAYGYGLFTGGLGAHYGAEALRSEEHTFDSSHRT